ncbi:MAG: FAD-dependent oxidoreductase [Clostridiales bacterium]|nr:FAD-dependent oxidoreductase [Clostridiales bacterium]
MNYEQKLRDLHSSFGEWWSCFETPKMTSELYPYDKMFSPITVNTLTLKNRLIMAPMGNISMCDETGRPNMKMLKYFEERAKGGVGLITTGLIPVSYGIDTSITERGDLTYFPRIDRSRTVFAGWRDLAAMCHSHGASVFIQLTPGLGRVGNPQCLTTQYTFPRSASFNPNWYMSDVPCMRLSDLSLERIIKRMGQSSADAKECNLDGIYLHGHEGYLLEQLSNPAFNHRKIGKFSNYETFGIEAVKEIKKRVGPNYPIMYRIDLSLALNATYKSKMDFVNPLNKFKNERTVAQSLEYMRKLVKAGVDMFDVDLGCYDNWWLPHPPASMPAGCFLDIADIAKKYFEENKILSNKGLPIPVAAVGKLGYPDLAEKALRDNKCDMVMLGRPLLADPEWCNKAYAGKVSDIRPCIGCQEACFNEFIEGGHPQCAVNPRTAFEEEYPREVPKADIIKHVAVVGAGPAGITAAETLIARGHFVDLYEKTDKLGGSLVPGSQAKIKFDLANYLDYLNGVVEKLKKNERFNLYLENAPTAEDLKLKGYDSIIIAAGTKQCKPPVKGIDDDNVVFAVDVLMNPELVKDAEKIVVVGGGVVGTETAYFLAYEHNKNVKVVEMDKYIMNHAFTANRGHIIHYLEEKGVELMNCTTLKKIGGGKVIVSQNKNKNVPNPYNTWSPILPENVVNPLDMLRPIKNECCERTLDADMVVLASGVKSSNELYYACVSEHAANEVFNIGDSFRSGRVFEAVRSAYRKSVSV